MLAMSTHTHTVQIKGHLDRTASVTTTIKTAATITTRDTSGETAGYLRQLQAARSTSNLHIWNAPARQNSCLIVLTFLCFFVLLSTLESFEFVFLTYAEMHSRHCRRASERSNNKSVHAPLYRKEVDDVRRRDREQVQALLCACRCHSIRVWMGDLLCGLDMDES